MDNGLLKDFSYLFYKKEHRACLAMFWRTILNCSQEQNYVWEQKYGT